MKKTFLACMGILACATILTGCGEKKTNTTTNTTTTTQDTTKVNTNQDVIKDQTVDVFKFEKTSLIYENGTSTLETKVTNTSSQTQYLSKFNIHVKDANGNEIITLTGYIGGDIPANESRTIKSSYGSDLTKAASITYELVK